MPFALFRKAEFESPDVATGTIRLSFASETPVLRSDAKGDKYWEVLSHGPGDANLGLINRSGLLLQNHDETQQIGDIVPNSVAVEADSKSRATIKITDVAWQKRVNAGERPGVSVGYLQLSIVKETRNEQDGIPIHHLSWSPYEISLLDGEPADDTVGLFRSKLTPPKQVTDDKPKSMTPEEIAAEAARKAKAEAADAVTAERARIAAIHKRSEKFIADFGKRAKGTMEKTLRDMTQEAVEKNEDFNVFVVRCQDAIMDAPLADPIGILDCASPKDAKKYSLLRAIQGALKSREAGELAIPKDGFENEVHVSFCRAAIANGGGGLGYSSRGFQVPLDTPIRVGHEFMRGMSRDLQASIFPAGGALVPTELLVPIIELLRNKEVLSRTGMRTIGGVTGGNLVIPRQTAPGTASFLAEIAAGASSQLTLDQISLSPHRLNSETRYSKQLLLQSAIGVEQLVMDDNMQILALKSDAAGLFGQGAGSEPLGLMNSPGVGSITYGATPTYKQIVSQETAIRQANVPGRLAFVSTPGTKGNLKTVAEALTGATTIGGSMNAIWKGQGEGDGEVIGYMAMDSQQIPNNQTILGEFSQFLRAIWGGLDVVLDQYTLASNAEWRVVFNLWLDFALRHPQAFVVSADSGAQ